MRARATKTAGELLDREMDKRKLGKRGLAKLIAGEKATQQDVENWRRALGRYGLGSNPTDAMAAVMESRLGKPAGYFPRHSPPQRRAANASLARLLDEVTALRADLAAHHQRLEALEAAVAPQEPTTEAQQG